MRLVPEWPAPFQREWLATLSTDGLQDAYRGIEVVRTAVGTADVLQEQEELYRWELERRGEMVPE